jgi:autotransporter translocation and assembly factor TamB
MVTKKKRRWWVRGLRGFGIGVAVLLLLVGGVLATVLWTGFGTRVVAEQALQRYSASVPGSISFESIEGSVGDNVCIGGLRLADAAEHDLVTIERVCLDIHLTKLVGRRLEVESLHATGAQLHLWEDAEWADLSNPESEPTDVLPGPDLGFALSGPISIERLEVIRHADEGDEIVVENGGLVGSIAGAETHAAATIDNVWGYVVPAEVFVAAGRGGIAWDSPRVAISGLTVVSSNGVVEQLDASYHVLDKQYAVSVDAVAFPPGEAVSLARVSVEGAGSWEDAGATVHASVPEYGDLDVEAMAAFAEARRASLVGEFRPRARGTTPRVHFVAGAELEGKHRSAHAIVNARNTVVAAVLEDDDAMAIASMPGASVEAAVQLQENAIESATARVSVSSAAQTLAELERLVPQRLPDFTGTASGEVEADCTHDDAWRCGLVAAVRHEDDWLGTTADVVARGKVVDIDLAHLAGRIRHERVRLAAPAHVQVRDGAATLTNVQLFAARGSIAADGTFAWKNARSDIEVDMKRIDLSTIARFAPKVPLRGRMHGQVHYAGTMTRPELDASITGAKLAWKGRKLGHVHVDAHYTHGLARTEIAWTQQGSSAKVQAEVPLVARLKGARKFELRTNQPALVNVDLEAFDLQQLEPWIGDKQLRGRVDGQVRAAGPLEDPTLVASITGSHLEQRGRDIGNVGIELTYGDAMAEANVKLAGSGAKGVIAARVPIEIELPSGRVKHHANNEHRFAALIERVDLHDLEPWLGGRKVRGIVGGEIDAVSKHGSTTADATIAARGLELDGQRFGAATIEAHADGRSTRVDLQLSGTQARLVEVVARLPLGLRGPTQKPIWRADDKFIVTAEMKDVDLAAVTTAARAEPLAGHIDGMVMLAGTAAVPQMNATLSVHGLAARGEELGWLRVVATYDDEEIVAELEQQNGVQQIVASGRVPITIDLARRKASWHRDGEHRLAVHTKGIDEKVVGTFVDLPSDLRFRVAAELDARGTIEDPRGMVRLRGNAQSGTKHVPSPISLVADIGRTKQEAKIMIGGQGPSGLVIEAKTDAPLPAVLAGKADLGAIEVDVHAHATDFYLEELAPFLPNVVHDPRGKLQLHASIEGPLQGPQLKGRVTMKDGEFTLVPLNQRFRDVDIDAELQGPDIALRRFTARSGDGSTSITAKLHVAPGQTKGEATVIARKLPVVRPGLPMMTVSTRVEAGLDATGEMTKIGLHVHDGFIDVLDTKAGNAAERIPPDDGVTYVDPQGQRAAAKEAKKGREPWIPRDMELGIRFVDLVRVRGTTADMDWGGQLRVVRRTGAKPKAEGELSTNSGRVTVMSNDFDISYGRITMPPHGDLDPFVDIVATTDTEEALVTMTVRGRVSRPALRLKADPPMPESDIFALLLTGHSDATEAQDGDFSAKAASLLAAFENPALQKQLRDKVGIDRVGVGFGDTVEEPIVTVGKRLNRKTYVEASYHHNAPEDENQAEVRLEYQFKPPRWSVETHFGDRAEGGVGLWWRRRFGGPKPEPKPKDKEKRRKETARKD